METAAPVRELVVPQKAHLVRTWKTQNDDGSYVDYTGYEARGSVRTTLDPDSGLILDLSPYLTVDGEEIQLEVPNDVTADLDFDAGFWDLLLESPTGQVDRFLQGPATLDRGVTP